jgi:hypothetical protein
MYRIEDAIVLVHPYPYVYGHLINELLPPFLAIPADIWARSVFLLPQSTLKGVVSELLDLCGKKPLAVKNMWRCVFARRLYVPNPWTFLTIWPDAIRAMRARILTRLGLETLIPQRRVIIQRTTNRRITNLDALFRAIVETYPRDNWLVTTAIPHSMEEQIRFFANISLLLIVHGSAGANAAWMRRNSVMIEIHVKFCESSHIQVARAVGVKAFEMSYAQRFSREVTVDIGCVMTAVEQANQFIKEAGYG